jgi:hypothetical protein
MSLANAACQLLYKVLQVFPPEGTQVPQGQRPGYILNAGQYTYPFQFKVSETLFLSFVHTTPRPYTQGFKLRSADNLVVTIQ